MTIEEELAQVSGGSIWLKEADGKAAGISLRNEDGSAGSWGYLWNTGDYYWRDEKLSFHDATVVATFTKRFGHQPDTVKEALSWYANREKNYHFS